MVLTNNREHSIQKLPVRNVGRPLWEILEEDFKEVIIDLRYVPFITSSGIGKFLLFYKTVISSGRSMQIKGISENLYDLFRSIKLDQLFSIQK